MRSLYLLLFSLVVVGFYTSCIRTEDSSFVGPSLCPTSNFKILEDFKLSKSKIDFNVDGTLGLSAKFNEKVSWAISIKGSSGAKKTFEGFSDSIQVEWYGNQDSLIFFQAENCVVSLTVACQNPIVENVKITTKNKFLNTKGYAYLLSDMENDTRVGSYPGGPTNLPGDTITFVSYGIDSSSISKSPAGGGFYRMEVAKKQNAWFFGGITFTKNAAFNVNSLKALSTDPSKIYFNCFIHGDDNFTNNQAQIYMSFGKIVKQDLNFSGWKYVSFKLSDLRITNLNNVAPEIQLGASPVQTRKGKIYVDFVVFTKDVPFIDLNKNQQK